MEINQNPLVSIIIPLFNSELYIEETIQSCLSQSYKNIEIIIVNDGSTDNSALIVLKLSENNPIIKIYNKLNTGVSNSRNFGFSISKGEYVIFLDSDDILGNEFIKNKILNFYSFDLIGSIIKKFKQNILNVIEEQKSITEDIFKNVLIFNKHENSCPSSYLIRRNFLIEHKIQFNESISCSADREFLLQISKFNPKIAFDQSSFLFYRHSENSMSNKLNIKLVLDIEKYYKIVEFKFPSGKIYSHIGYKILYKSFLKLFYFKKGFYYFFKVIISFSINYSKIYLQTISKILKLTY